MDMLKMMCAVVLGCAVVSPAVAADGGPDELWKITVKTDMAGMPAAMPPQTSQVCMKKGQAQGQPQMAKDCQVYDLTQSNGKVSYRFKCTGQTAMTGEGETTLSADGYQGSWHAKITAGGKPMEMKQSYSAKRLGSCTYVAKK